MFSYIKDICKAIDKKIELIESNKTAPVEEHVIIATNTKLLNEVKNLLVKLDRESCNDTLKAQYKKMVESVIVL